jgi:hypothetical protein
VPQEVQEAAKNSKILKFRFGKQGGWDWGMEG